MLESIAAKIQEAATESQKIAMFHLLVLKHSDELMNMDPTDFCRKTRVPESYSTEFRKMLALRRLMREEKIGLALF
jgi:hypothetical protein